MQELNYDNVKQQEAELYLKLVFGMKLCWVEQGSWICELLGRKILFPTLTVNQEQ